MGGRLDLRPGRYRLERGERPRDLLAWRRIGAPRGSQERGFELIEPACEGSAGAVLAERKARLSVAGDREAHDPVFPND